MRKHPHGRGEDTPKSLSRPPKIETPPRAWGRQHQKESFLQNFRNTPTGVGKTTRGPLIEWANWKHPHGRGEDKPTRSNNNSHLETPPRAWGRRLHVPTPLPSPRNTPTGVGKTRPYFSFKNSIKKHPHGRGEDLMMR